MEELSRSVTILQKQVETLQRELEEIKKKERLEEKTEDLQEPWHVREIHAIMQRLYKENKEGVFITAGFDKDSRWVIDGQISKILQTPTEEAVKLLSPFSSEHRIKILMELVRYPKSATDLSNATGLDGGQLYHHLDPLLDAGYVNKEYRGKYALTKLGEVSILSSLLLASSWRRLVKGAFKTPAEDKEPDDQD